MRGGAAALAGLGEVAVGEAPPVAADGPAPPGLWAATVRLFGVGAALLERRGSVRDIADRQP